MLFTELENGLQLANAFVYAHVRTRQRLALSLDEILEVDYMDPEVCNVSCSPS